MSSYAKPWPFFDIRLIFINLFMHSLPGMDLLYFSEPFYTEGVLHKIY